MYPQRSVMTCGLATALEPPHFNHAPVRGAIGAIQYVAGYVTKFQSTHPRGVRRDGSITGRRRVLVSIHAPAWGATWGKQDKRLEKVEVSIHAPAWGATPAHQRRPACHQVSIHAPAWGATGSFRPVSFGTNGFQSTHPRGVRLSPIAHAGTPIKVSIHAPAWGATVTAEAPNQDQEDVSIHAPAWGATMSQRLRDVHDGVSIHAPAWGATT